MHTILLIMNSVSRSRIEISNSLKEAVTSDLFDQERVDGLLDMFQAMNNLNGTTASHFETGDKTLFVLRPQFAKIERAISKRCKVLQQIESSDPVVLMQTLKTYEAIFKKNRREVQTFDYQVSDFFSQVLGDRMKKMIHFKLSNSSDYMPSGIQRHKFHFVWNPEVEEFQLLNKVPGLVLLNATPFESYCVSLSKLSRGYLIVEIDSNNFFSLEKHTPTIKGSTLTVKREVYYSGRRIDPRTEFLSKDTLFVKKVLRQAYERMEKMFQVHTILYGKIA